MVLMNLFAGHQLSDFFLSSKWVIKQQRQLAISTMHLAQELLTNIQSSGGSNGKTSAYNAGDPSSIPGLGR